MENPLEGRNDWAFVAGGLAAGAAALLFLRRSKVARTAGRRAADASRLIDMGASTLAFSVLADSGIEHFRGGYYNPAMFVAPGMAGITLATAASAARDPTPRSTLRSLVFGAAAVTGVAGFGFHLYNISKRTGGWDWGNLFYGAPVGAPMALNLAGLLGLAGSRIARARDPGGTRLLGADAGKVLGLGAAGALAGTAAEAGLLHFRGAFQDPFMYLPVTVPPAAALALAGASLGAPRAGPIARFLLRLTAFLGFAGVGFHALGIARNMGGWRNWSQNVQNGPPLPAPPSFTGLALAGLAALDLQRRRAA